MLFLTYSSRCLPTLPVGPLAQLCTTLQPVTVPPQIVGQHLMPGKAKPCIVGAGLAPNTSHLRPKGGKRRQKAPNLAQCQKHQKQEGAFDVQITRDGCR